MICSSVKTLQLLLLVLTLSTLSTSIAAADYTKQHQQHGGVASIRGGRILQEMDDDLEETTTTTIVPMSADDEDESAASEIEEASVEGEEPSVDDSEDGEMSSRSGVIAPTKRKCTTGKLFALSLIPSFELLASPHFLPIMLLLGGVRTIQGQCQL